MKFKNKINHENDKKKNSNQINGDHIWYMKKKTKNMIKLNQNFNFMNISNKK